MRSKQLLHQQSVILLLLFMYCCIALLCLLCDGSSRIHVHQMTFKKPLRPHYHHHHHGNNQAAEIMGFLPRGIPIPNSAPSRKHNSIGLQSWPWRPSRTSSSLGSP